MRGALEAGKQAWRIDGNKTRTHKPERVAFARSLEPGQAMQLTSTN